MAELATQDISIALYRYLCLCIVGTEEHIKTIRMMNTIRDNLSSDNIAAVITCGSFGEGLEMGGSDLDIMQIFKFHEVYEGTDIPIKPGISCFTMETDDTQLGYTRLRLLHNNHWDLPDICVKRGNDLFLSGSSCKQMVLSNFMSVVHGPCISDEKGHYDLAVSLHSKLWITPALQWITRKITNNSWPDNFIKASIVQHGVLFVPIGAQGSSYEDLEWRISFSVGEKLLIFSFTHTQLLCYALMKIILKDIIAIDLQCSGLLCSYFMKTIVFWISEEYSPAIWKPEKLISMFMRCLRRLVYCVKYSVCPHYFIPEINLFENKIKGHAQKILLKKIVSINSYGWKCLLFSNRFSNFYKLFIGRPKEPFCLRVTWIENLLCSIINLADYTTAEFSLKKRLWNILSFESSKIKYLYWYYVSKLSSNCVQLLIFDETFISGNKSSYLQYKNYMSTILRNLRHDAVSGWLLLSSFFYKRKQYKLALYILQYVLSKCTSEKMQRFRNLSHMYCELINLSLFRKMTIVQLLKYLLVDNAVFPVNSTLIPKELQVEVRLERIGIPPLVYAHFLQFLCHYHLNETLQCRNSIRDLKLIVVENSFIAKPIEQALSCRILGIAFQLTGDKESAKQAFTQSIGLEPDPTKNSSYSRLSIINSM